MSIFARAHYTSDATQFIEQMRKQKPTLEAEQRAGRALLWDKQIDRQTQNEIDAGEVAQQPYVYQTHG